MSFWEGVDKEQERVKARWKKDRADDLAFIIVRGPLTFMFILLFVLLIF